ncbi:NAD-dependent epimerase/dehydratase family protein [Alphaproteobacteria bacterium]|nr:NAD-dependent epimerase/dehydratase family protein [Alphaproteobacteria bacterium]
MNWVITGGCGFLGTALIARLIKDTQDNIRILDNLSVGTREDLSLVSKFSEQSGNNLSWCHDERVTLVVGDILDYDLALLVTSGADIIVHFAANTGVGPSVDNPRLDMTLNVVGTFNYLEAARLNNAPRFIYASSGAPAGEVEPPIHEELPPHPVSPYGASKLAGEGYCSAYNKTFGIDTVMLRFGNVYGPGSLHKSSVVAKFIRQAMDGETLEIYGDGSQTRDFIYIDDLINAVLLASKVSNIGGEAFQIATNKETTVGKMAELLVSEMSKIGLKNIKLKNTEKRLGDVMRNYSDTSKARGLLGWNAKTNLRDGIKKTVDYFIK